jgi:hypothetical protein
MREKEAASKSESNVSHVGIIAPKINLVVLPLKM